jgi:hypothetical protein
MKYYETTFDEYVQSVQKNNFHSEIQNTAGMDLRQMKNAVFYGGSGVGKYSQVLNWICRYSPSHLKYDKKMTIQTDKTTYTYRFSDIHYEIDLALLGCNSRILWELFFNQIIDILSVKVDKIGIVVCKNFHCIHNELLEVFYGFMKQYQNLDSIFNKNGVYIKYILITEHLSFLPNNILHCCNIVKVKKPDCVKNIEPFAKEGSLKNLKEMTNLRNSGNSVDVFNSVCFPILHEIKQVYDMRRLGTEKNVDLLKFRDLLYNISIYQIDILECLWFILFALVKEGYLTNAELPKIIAEIFEFLRFHNNNYRTIFHFERIFLFLII